jgi:hypothetical protein
MPRHGALLALEKALRTAAAVDDWAALQMADRKVANGLRAMATGAAWTPAERAAMLSLRKAHAETRAHCAASLASVGQHLSNLQANKEGWLAYALNSGIEQDEKQA